MNLIHSECIAAMKEMPDNSIDSVVTDPPYHLTSIVKRFGKPNSAPAKHGTDGAFARASRGFMGKEWDGGDIAFRVELWEQVWRVLKPGGHLLAFSGSRTYHRMACAIEDAGFEIRDQLMWIYGSGFPKSHDVSKAIDKAAGAEREVIGYSQARSSSIHGGGQSVGIPDPITRAATPEAEQWEGWGTALKPAHEPICMARKPLSGTVAQNVLEYGTGAINIDGCRVGERFPANVLHDGIAEDWARYFYCAKASKKDRGDGNTHPTVKPTDLMRYLCRLVTPSGGIILDPFMGSGSTGKAAKMEGFRFVGCEMEKEYFEIAKSRIDAVQESLL